MATNHHVVGVVAKPRRQEALAKAAEVVAWLAQRGVEWRVDSEFAAARSDLKIAPHQIVARRDMTAACSVIVVLGGDGTLISAARHPAERPPTIIGVNLGTLGFLNEINLPELYPVISSVLEDSAQLDRRYLLSARLVHADSSETQSFAINDVVIGKETLARIFAVELMIDGEPAAAVRGDGIIVSSPTGSTAYSLAAGGSIVHPGVDALLLTPICPHALTFRPLVLPGGSKIALRVAGKSPQDADRVYLTIDGQEGFPLSSGDMVLVERSPHWVNFVKSPSRHFFETLSIKLKWANL